MEGAISASTAAQPDKKLSSSRSNQSLTSNTQTEQIPEPAAQASYQYRTSPIKSHSIPIGDYGKVDRALEAGASGVGNVEPHLEHNIKAPRDQ